MTQAMTTGELKERLRAHYTSKHPQGREYAYLEEVCEHPQGGGRTCDAIAVGLWASRGHALIGHEIKVSRSDWLRELADLTKTDPFVRFCRQWYVVAAVGVVVPGELPPNWGLLEPTPRGAMKASVVAPVLTPVPVSMTFMCSLLRRAVQAGYPQQEVDNAVAKARTRWEAEGAVRTFTDTAATEEAREYRRAFQALKQGLGEHWLNSDEETMRQVGEAARDSYSGGKTIARARTEASRIAQMLRARADDLDKLAL